MASLAVSKTKEAAPVAGAASRPPRPSDYGIRGLQGVYVWYFDPMRYTPWALSQRGYAARKGTWINGFFHMNRPGCSPGGSDDRDRDEDGFNEVAFVGTGEISNAWAEKTWKLHYRGIYDWYKSEERRPYFFRAILIFKSDVYTHSDKVWNEG